MKDLRFGDKIIVPRPDKYESFPIEPGVYLVIGWDHSNKYRVCSELYTKNKRGSNYSYNYDSLIPEGFISDKCIVQNFNGFKK